MYITREDVQEYSFGADPERVSEISLTNKGLVEIGGELAKLPALTDVNLSVG